MFQLLRRSLRSLILSSIVLISSSRAHAAEPITSGTAITGGVLGTVIGFGLGHAVQGRTWLPYFLIEGAGLGLAIAGNDSLKCEPVEVGFGDFEVNCIYEQEELIIAGAGLYIAARLVEIVDVWVGGFNRVPSKPTQSAEREQRLVPFIKPVAIASARGALGFTAGMTLHF